MSFMMSLVIPVQEWKQIKLEKRKRSSMGSCMGFSLLGSQERQIRRESVRYSGVRSVTQWRRGHFVFPEKLFDHPLVFAFVFSNTSSKKAEMPKQQLGYEGDRAIARPWFDNNNSIIRYCWISSHQSSALWWCFLYKIKRRKQSLLFVQQFPFLKVQTMPFWLVSDYFI